MGAAMSKCRKKVRRMHTKLQRVRPLFLREQIRLSELGVFGPAMALIGAGLLTISNLRFRKSLD